jgi:hypothetical protein
MRATALKPLHCILLLCYPSTTQVLDEADRFTDAESYSTVCKMHAKLKSAIVASGDASARLQVRWLLLLIEFTRGDGGLNTSSEGLALVA